MNDLSADDRLAIIQVVSDFAHMVDNQDYGRIGEVFAEDFVAERGGVGPDVVGHEGVKANLQGRQAFNHLSTDVCIRGREGDGYRVDSKFIGFLRDGSLMTGEHRNIVVRTDAGWRLARRRTIVRNAATTAP